MGAGNSPVPTSGYRAGHTMECYSALKGREALTLQWVDLEHVTLNERSGHVSAHTQCDSVCTKRPEQADPELDDGQAVARGWGRGMGVTACPWGGRVPPQHMGMVAQLLVRRQLLNYSLPV